MKHIVFDLGQVLIRWSPEHAFKGHFPDAPAMHDWMERVGFHGWNKLQDGGRSLIDGLTVARAAHGADAAPLEDYGRNFAATIAEPVPGSWEIAQTLKARGHRLFAITNWSTDNWPAAQQLYPQLATLFDDIVVSGIEGIMKPQPEIYLILTRRNNISAADCIFIDDSAANVAGAQAVGMDAILFRDAESLQTSLAERGIR